MFFEYSFQDNQVIEAPFEFLCMVPNAPDRIEILDGVEPAEPAYPQGLAGETGYAGLLHLTLSDQRGRLTNLYWRQSFFDSRLVIYVGFLDATDWQFAVHMGAAQTAPPAPDRTVAAD